MRIAFVTATGADEGTHIPDLLAVDREFPRKIEWGILLSRNNGGEPRWPKPRWIESLLGEASPETSLAGHLCGRYVRELCQGHRSYLPPRWNRLQINFHGLDYGEGDALTPVLRGSANQWIFQIEGVNDHRLGLARDSGINAVPLYDLSHGGGVLPESWPDPIPGLLNGYAGGLSPGNLSEQLKRLEERVGGATIWIDAETHLRNEDDQFDLGYVRRFVETASRYF